MGRQARIRRARRAWIPRMDWSERILVFWRVLNNSKIRGPRKARRLERRKRRSVFTQMMSAATMMATTAMLSERTK